MGEIPEDVMSAARQAAVGIRCFPPSDMEPLTLSVARAILAERQRCADVAMKYKERDPGEDGSGYWAAEEIAAAILNP